MKSNRILILAVSIFVLFSALVAQFFRLQVLESEKWQKKADGQHYFVISEPFVRGTFYANTSIKKGHPEIPQKLAVDIRKYHLCVDPHSIPQEKKREIAQTLIALSRPTEEETKRFALQFDKKSRNRKLASWLDEEKRKAVLKWWQPYARQNGIASNAIFFVPDHLRVHPFGKLLGQVLHTVQMQKDEKTGSAIPTGGLELSCNKYLNGQKGKRKLMRSPRHSMHLQQVIKEPVHGADVYLTINHCLQAIVEEEIEKGVKLCKAKNGWAILMDPHNGHILALAQYPFFYPDQYPLYFKRPDLMEHAKLKAITDAYEPGSTMKPLSIAIALQANQERRARGEKELFHPLEKINTSKGNFPGRGKKPLTDTHFHNYLNMYMAIQKSSNIYCATLIQRVVQTLGNDWYRNILHNTFGFGKKVSIGLSGESVGVLPTPGKNHPNGAPEWSVPTPYSLAMGHNLQATSLQMCRAYAILANGGYFVTPTLIKKVVSPTGELLVDNCSPKEFPKVLDDSVIKEVVQAMKYATKPGSSSSSADIFGYTEVGKTGTSMKLVGGVYSPKSHFSSFIGFAPVSNPAFVLFIGMDEPEPGFVPGRGLNHRGSICAAPLFRAIGTRVLEYLGVPPDDPAGYPKGDPRHDPDKADWVREATALRKLYQEWNGK